MMPQYSAKDSAKAALAQRAPPAAENPIKKTNVPLQPSRQERTLPPQVGHFAASKGGAGHGPAHGSKHSARPVAQESSQCLGMAQQCVDASGVQAAGHLRAAQEGELQE